MTVTRCAVRTAAGFVGHAYVAGREERRALLAALADALMQDPEHSYDIENQLIAPLERDQIERRRQRAQRAAATRVQFFALQTMRT
jgi:alpha-D-ribose 1-methylphosphonate 5-triphosphate synthase subunit PhnG